MTTQGEKPTTDDPIFWRIYELRQKNESDADFARRMGVTPSTYSEWKRGRAHPGDRETLITVADELGVSLDWLLTGEEHEPQGPSRHNIVRQLNKVIDWIQGEAVDWHPNGDGETPAIRSGDPQLPSDGPLSEGRSAS